jgi:hypothetical protein
MMYTFTVMFFLLTVINLPIYILYESNTQANNLSDINTFFKYFTLGNLGQLTVFCGYSDFAYRFDENKNVPDNLSIDCGLGYIQKIRNFGFMYDFDPEYGNTADGSA